LINDIKTFTEIKLLNKISYKIYYIMKIDISIIIFENKIKHIFYSIYFKSKKVDRVQSVGKEKSVWSGE